MGRFFNAVQVDPNRFPSNLSPPFPPTRNALTCVNAFRRD